MQRFTQDKMIQGETLCPGPYYPLFTIGMAVRGDVHILPDVQIDHVVGVYKHLRVASSLQAFKHCYPHPSLGIDNRIENLHLVYESPVPCKKPNYRCGSLSLSLAR